MKKTFLIIAALFSVGSMAAGDFGSTDKQVLNHLGASVGVGTTGITVDLSTTVTPFLGLRAGADFMPNLRVASFNLSVSDGTGNAKSVYEQLQPEGLKKPEKIGVGVKPGWATGHVLLDIYFTRKSKFHLTAGAYFAGKDHFLKIENKEEGVFHDIYDFNHSLGAYASVDHSQVGYIGIKMKDGYIIAPDKAGNMEGKFTVNKVRPYVGLGWGRAVPQKRVGFSADLGVQFWGTPKAYIMEREVGSDDLEDKKACDAVKNVRKYIKVYPCLTFRLTGRIF